MEYKAYHGFLVYRDGRLFSTKVNRFLNPSPNSHGYYQVTIAGKSQKVHRIVAHLFVDNPNKFSVVNHIDGDKSNNSAENLEWCTQSHNLSHAFSLGLNKCNSKLSAWQVKAIRLFLRYNMYSRKRLSEIFGVGIIQIGRIHRNEIYLHIK